MLEKNHDNFDENFADIDQIDPSKKLLSMEVPLQ